VTPEWSRPERLDQIAERERTVEISATVAERAALAARFDLVAIDRLDADFAIRREAGDTVIARGRVRADVVQRCSVTAEPLRARVDEPVELRFVPALGGDEEELELSADALDTVAYEGGAVDLGEAAAETVALALDPFPRAPGAAEALRAAGVVSEEEAGPFGKLAALKDRLGG
jgi:uncharacterized metal-binding protein YceD (DUF177 family)